MNVCTTLTVLCSVLHSSISLSFLVEPPPTVDFSHSQQTVIPCVVSDDAVAEWYKLDSNWTLVTNISGVRIVRATELVFLAFSPQQFSPSVHHSIYRCFARSPIGTIASRNVFVRAVIFDSFEINVYDEYVIRGSNAVFKCQIPSQLKQYLYVNSWIRDDGFQINNPLKTGTKYLLINGFLVVSGVSSIDQHNSYRCSVKNRITEQTQTSISSGKLIITDPNQAISPRIQILSKELFVKKDQNLRVYCLTQSYPRAQHYWKLNSIYLLEEKQDFLDLQNIQNSLTVTCLANNSVGQDSFETRVTVKEPISVSLEVIKLDKHLKLNCSISGQPIDSVSFARNGFQINGLKRATEMLVSHELGCYSCRVNDESESIVGHKCLKHDLPKFKHVFGRHVLNVGERVSLRCVASGSPIPTISWTLDGQNIGETQRIQFGDYVSSNGHNINSFVNISHVRIEDNGIYECLASNSAGSIKHSETVAVLGQMFMRAMNNITAIDGQTLTIRCPVVQLEVNTPKIIWTKGNKEVSLLSERHVSYENGTLVIRDLNRHVDSGQYTCSAHLKGQNARQSVNIQILKKPVLSGFSFPSSLTSGQRVIVTCSILEGDQPIRLKWLFASNSLISRDIEEISMGDMGSSLLFRKVQKSHSGQYTCLAENSAGNTTFSAELVVRVAPKWIIEPRDQSVVLGENARFDCQSDGFPLPIIRWKLKTGNSKEFRALSSSYRIQSLENGSLVIKEVDKSDQGHYVCEAGNGVGADISVVVALKVNIGAHFKKTFQLLKVLKEKPFLMICETFGEKPLTIKWQKDRNQIPNRLRIQEIPTSEGLISRLTASSALRTDSGHYSCQAFNAFGNSEMNFQLLVEEEPDAPNSVGVSELGSVGVSLKWMKPFSGNNPILKYLIEWKKEKDNSFENKLETEDTHVTIGQLQPMTSYEFRIKAQNAIGLSSESRIVATTEEEIPTTVPEDIKVVAISSNSVKITWKALRAESRVRGYYIGYKAVNSLEPKTFKTIEFTENEFVLNSLEKNQKYLITVQAFNNKGAGPQSQEVLGQTFAYDAPSTPRLSLQTIDDITRVNITWFIDTENPIKGFKLFLRKVPENWIELSHVIGSDQRSFLVTSLECPNHYQFYILAFNDLALSSPSEMVSRDLSQQSVGFSPEMTSLLSINSTQIEIHLNSWKSRGFCPIRYFTVKYKEYIDQSWTLVSDRVSPETTTLSVNGLKPGKWYSLLLSAHNSDQLFSDKEYLFSTLTIDGGTVAPMMSHVIRDEKRLNKYLIVLIPISCALSVLLVISFVLIYICLKKSEEIPEISRDVSINQFKKSCEELPTPYAQTHFITQDNYDLPQKLNRRDNEYETIELHSHHCCRH